jgi:phage tail sheath protein FI
MAFQLSPGVLVTEQDLTSVVPAVATTAGGFAGAFAWGPVGVVTTVDSENALVTTFGKPNSSTFQSFFTAANFLSYGNNLQVIRVVNQATAKNAAVVAANVVIIRNEDHYTASYSSGEGSVGEWAAKYPGTLGNSLRVSMADANAWSTWSYAANFDAAPSTSTYVSDLGGSHDELHIAVIDEDGLFSGTAGTVVEKFAFASKASDAKRADGTSAYYKDVVNNQSAYIYWMDHTANVAASGTAWGNAANASLFANLTSNVTVSLAGGVSADSPTDGNITSALALFANDEAYDISLLPLGAASSTVVNFAISSIAEVRKDVIVFASPTLANVVNNAGSEATDVVTFRESLTSSSYAVLDSGWKYQYDRYNDVYRWIPLNGDTAGLAVRTDFVADPWFSPAGFNRGQVKNVVKLAYSPSKTDRDTLYKKGINPVVTFPGNGTVLFGDKTLLAKPSAFDRINVRRLFIVLEKAIATAAKFQLFEFNDPFTRAQFRNLVEPFLRDVQGRRGITDFKVVCDESNNTAQVIDTNNFVADIFIKPARAINFIQLNFIATRSGISFEEVGA